VQSITAVHPGGASNTLPTLQTVAVLDRQSDSLVVDRSEKALSALARRLVAPTESLGVELDRREAILRELLSKGVVQPDAVRERLSNALPAPSPR
jgi:hypothetical protein